MPERAPPRVSVIAEAFRRCQPYLANGRTGALWDVYEDHWARSGDCLQLATDLLDHRSYWEHLERSAEPQQAEFAFLGAACLLLRWGLHGRSRVLLRMASSYDGQAKADVPRLNQLCVDYEHQAGEAIQPGIMAHDSGRFDEALAVYERAIADYPGATLPLYERAWTTRVAGVGSVAEREALYDRVRAVDPFYVDAITDQSGDAPLIRAAIWPWLHGPGGTPGTCARFANAARRLGQWWAAGPAFLRLAHLGIPEATKEFSSICAATLQGRVPVSNDMDVAFSPPPAATNSQLETEYRRLRQAIAAARETGVANYIAQAFRLVEEAQRASTDAHPLLDGVVRAWLVAGQADVLAGQAPRAKEWAEMVLRVHASVRLSDFLDVASAYAIIGDAETRMSNFSAALSGFQRAAYFTEAAPHATLAQLVMAKLDVADTLWRATAQAAARTLAEEAAAILPAVPRHQPPVSAGRPEDDVVAARFRTVLTEAICAAAIRNASAARTKIAEAEQLLAEFPRLAASTARRYQLANARADLYHLTKETGQATDALRQMVALERELGYQPGRGTEQNLAVMLISAEHYDEAAELLDLTVNAKTDIFGADSAEAASANATRGYLEIARGDTGAAEQRLREALPVLDAHLPPGHPSRVETATMLGVVRAHQHDLGEACTLLDAGIAGEFAALIENIGVDEDEQRDTAMRRQPSIGVLVAAALATRELPHLSMACEAMTNYKSLSVGLSRSLRSVPVEGDLAGRLRNAVDRYTALAVRGPGAAGSASTYLAELHAVISAYTPMIAELDRKRNSGHSYRRLTGIAGLLPEGTVLLDVSLVVEAALDAQRAQEVAGTGDRDAYVGTLIDRSGIRNMIRLGAVSDIDKLLADFRSEIAGFPLLLEVLHAAATAAMLQLCERLYQVLLAPFARELSSANAIVLFLDGNLAMFPWACLWLPEKRFAVERWQLSYLTSLDDLSAAERGTGRDKRDGTEVALVSVPDYGSPRPGGTDADAVAGVVAPFSAALRTNWESLAAAAVEADAIRGILPSGLLTDLHGAAATKTAISRLHGPAVLHIATHGFYVPERRLAVLPGDASADPPRMTLYADLLTRCGLVLAGANERRQLTSHARDDGILTGLELSFADLAGTHLVVLSTCEGGLGEPMRGDAVQGLRRACHLAGAGTVVSALWKVPDRATARLMELFYEALTRNEPIRGSLAGAMRQVIRGQTPDGLPSHPYHWASWTLSGRAEVSAQAVNLPLRHGTALLEASGLAGGGGLWAPDGTPV